MTEGDGSVEAEELQARLSEKWRVEHDRDGVYGYADAHCTTICPESGEVRACFSLRPQGSLWGATWKGPHYLGDELTTVSDNMTGVKERCIEWIVEKAEDLEGRTDA